MIIDPSPQMPLTIPWNTRFSLDNFIASENDELIDKLRQCVVGDEGQFTFLWGLQVVGKTHLLQAICREAREHNHAAMYLSLSQEDITVDILEGLSAFRVVCLDNVHQVAGDAVWEQALFEFYNRMQDQQGMLVMAALQRPLECGFQLADLLSRLQWGLLYPLLAPNDDDKLKVLAQYVSTRGMDIHTRVLTYLIHHRSRRVDDLLALLDQLNETSLVAKKRITIPFVQAYLEQFQSSVTTVE